MVSSDHGEERDGPELERDIRNAVSFQQDAADDAQEMSERENFADRLRPVRHAAKGKHEAGEQDRRKEDEESHLHRLKLVLRDRGKGDAHGEVRGDEDERDDDQQKEMLPCIGT